MAMSCVEGRRDTARSKGRGTGQTGGEFAVRVAGAPRDADIARGGRIVNGTDAAPGQFPFQVRNPDRTQLSIGQSLVRPQRPLTGSQFI
jgi:hypothetical protein